MEAGRQHTSNILDAGPATPDGTAETMKNLQNSFKYHVAPRIMCGVPLMLVQWVAVHSLIRSEVAIEDFNSDVPGETAELWVGTPYAKWIAP